MTFRDLHSPIFHLVAIATVFLSQTVLADHFSPTEPLSFVNDVIPVMTKMGCNRGACHGAAKGKGGFKLSLRGAEPDQDYRSIQRDFVQRRIDRLRPKNSLLLLKPTMAVSHLGGHALQRNSEAYAILHAWIRQGMPGLSEADPTLESLQIIQPASSLTLEPDAHAQLLVQAQYSDGNVRDVTRWSHYETNDATVAEAHLDGRISAIGSGKAAISVNYQGKFNAVEVVVPFAESVDEAIYASLPHANYIDEILIREWQRLRLTPSSLADDATFLRRAYLDITGTLPSPERVLEFIGDTTPDKRELLVDQLFTRPEAVDLWIIKLGDIFRTSSEWLGAEGLLAFNNYLREALTANRPYDQLVRELVSGSGDAFQVGPPNYMRLYLAGGTQNWHLNLSETIAQTFLGIRLQCARCHDHPLDVWTQDDYFGLAGFFSRVKRTRPAGKSEGAESIIMEHGLHEVPHPRKGILPPRTLDGLEMYARSDVGTLWDGANWIWDVADAAQNAEAKVPRYFRKTIELSAPLIAAQIYCTADDAFSLYVNGEKVGSGASWSDAQRFDLTDRLTVGKNVLAIEVVNQTGPGSVLAWMQILEHDASSTFLASDATFRVSKTHSDDWHTLAFDDSQWAAAIVQGASTMEPWKYQPERAAPLNSEYQPRREFFAEWLTSSENKLFARMAVNRMWRHFMKRGLVEPVDDFRLTNPPTSEVLLDALANDFVAHGYDMRYLMTQIVKSQAYQLTSAPTASNADDHMFYSHYYPRRMTAEQIFDALCQTTGIAEDFPGQEKGTRAQQLADTKIGSAFLDAFGRPLRRNPSCECERIQDPNLGQVLELMNGEELHQRVISEEGLVQRSIGAGLDNPKLLEQIYLTVHARLPQLQEVEVLLSAAPQNDAASRREYFEDILWALLNGKEFLFNH